MSESRDPTDVLRVAVVQHAAALDPAENRAFLEALADSDGRDGGVGEADAAALAACDLVVLPEAFARDFGSPGSDVSPFAERADGDGAFVQACRCLAAATGATVVAGMFEDGPDPARPYNTLVAVGPDGVRATYRKAHLYDSFGYRESARLSAGDLTPVVLDVAGLGVGLMTCYDLRFPEMSRLLVDAGAEVLLVPAAWVAGERKVRHWQTLLAARAIENTVYVVAAAQPGPRYTGHSAVLDPRGDVLAEAGPEGHAVLVAEVTRTGLEAARAENPSLANRRLRGGAGAGSARTCG